MKTCLIVDDSEIVRKYARLIFESLSYRVLDADRPQAAFERLEGETPDLILADWKMPGVSTHDFIAQVRRMTNLRRPYILYLSTENDAADFDRAAKAGADDYLLKPFNREIIEMKLKEIRVAA